MAFSFQELLSAIHRARAEQAAGGLNHSGLAEQLASGLHPSLPHISHGPFPHPGPVLGGVPHGFGGPGMGGPPAKDPGYADNPPLKDPGYDGTSVYKGTEGKVYDDGVPKLGGIDISKIGGYYPKDPSVDVSTGGKYVPSSFGLSGGYNRIGPPVHPAVLAAQKALMGYA